VAPVLQCPECGTRHPLDSIGDRSAFPCTGCGRALKVPEQARALVPEVPPDRQPASVSAPVVAPPAVSPFVPAPPGPDVSPDPDATRVFSTTVPPMTKTAAAPVAPPGLADDDFEPIGVEPPDVAMPPSRASAAAPPVGAGAPLGAIPGRWARFGMWIIAVPLAFLVVFGLAKVFGLLTTNDITDVALAEGWQRFVPIARLVPFVALATAGFVHGGAYGIARFRAGRSRAPRPASPTSRPRAPRQPSGPTR
jgi:hypothetical protein